VSVTLPADVILSKNKLYQNAAFVELFEWQISETREVLRVANYNEDFLWSGETWSKFWFEGGDVSDTGGDKSETLQIRVSAVDKVVQEYLEELVAGGIGDTVIYRRVHSEYLTTAFLTATYEILNIDAGPNNEWVVFDLGQENLFLNQFPAHVTSRDLCRYKPSDTDICPYVNSASCSRSFDDCIWLGQESIFGGQPGIPGGIFNVESFRSLYITSALDAKLNKPGITKTFVFDAVIGGVQRTYFDAIIIPGDKSQTLAVDALINKVQTSTLSLSALINETIERTLGIDAQLEALSTVTQVSLDAVIYGVLTIQIDSYLSKEQTSTLSIDGLIEEDKTAQFFIDAIILLTQSSTSLDSILQKRYTKETSIDAILYGLKQTNLDALIRSVGNLETFDIDAYLQKIYTKTTSLDAKFNVSEQTIFAGIDAQLYGVDSYYEETKLDAILFGDFIEQPGGGAIEEPGGGGFVEEPS